MLCLLLLFCVGVQTHACHGGVTCERVSVCMCVCVYAYVYVFVCVSLWSWFSSHFLWVPGIKLKSTDFYVNLFFNF